MELGGGDAAGAHHGPKGHAVEAGGHHVVTACLGGIGVHEVRVGAVDPGHQRVVADHGEHVPAHVGHRDTVGQAPHHARQQPQARLGVLLGGLEQNLHAHTDAQHRPAGRRPPPQQRLEALGAQLAHALTEVAHAGHDQGVGILCVSSGGDQAGVGPRALQRPLSRAQVPGAVIQHRHRRGLIGAAGGRGLSLVLRLAAHPSTPLVEGTPAPVTATARRKATATALNTASWAWWPLSARSRVTCRVSPAWVASASRKWLVSWDS